MHASASALGKLFFDTYGFTGTVLDIGSTDVNGSLRRFCKNKYIGIDFSPGAGVDIVLEDPYKLPFAEGEADAVVSSSCFEHSEMFWLVFLEILRVLKPEGVFWRGETGSSNRLRGPKTWIGCDASRTSRRDEDRTDVRQG